MNVMNKRRLLLLGLAAGALPFRFSSGQTKPEVIKVTARRFSFNPEEIRLKKGIPVVLELTSLDVLMGFNAPDLGVRADVLPGTVSQLAFTPQASGRFTFYCDIFCGSGHEGMSGVIQVS